MQRHELAARIKCELDVNDPEFGETLPGASELMDRLREKGFTGEEAHLLASAPGLLRKVLTHLEEPEMWAPYMLRKDLETMCKTVQNLIKQAKHADLRPEDDLLQQVEQYFTARLELMPKEDQ